MQAVLTQTICSKCGQEIRGKILVALNKAFHPEHFVCVDCNAALTSVTYFENLGLIYCTEHYIKNFMNKCNACKMPISGKPLMALGQEWHEEHFACTTCNKLLSNINFYEGDGQPYCKIDYVRKYVDVCTTCKEPIIDENHNKKCMMTIPGTEHSIPTYIYAVHRLPKQVQQKILKIRPTPRCPLKALRVLTSYQFSSLIDDEDKYEILFGKRSMPKVYVPKTEEQVQVPSSTSSSKQKQNMAEPSTQELKQDIVEQISEKDKQDVAEPTSKKQKQTSTEEDITGQSTQKDIAKPSTKRPLQGAVWQRFKQQKSQVNTQKKKIQNYYYGPSYNKNISDITESSANKTMGDIKLSSTPQKTQDSLIEGKLQTVSKSDTQEEMQDKKPLSIQQEIQAIIKELNIELDMNDNSTGSNLEQEMHDITALTSTEQEMQDVTEVKSCPKIQDVTESNITPMSQDVTEPKFHTEIMDITEPNLEQEIQNTQKEKGYLDDILDSESNQSKTQHIKKENITLSKRQIYEKKKMKMKTWLQPKNSLMFLHELFREEKFSIIEKKNEPSSSREEGRSTFLASIQIEGKLYKGRGKNKSEAKVNAAENAVREYVLDKVNIRAIDDLPWEHVCSYALHKLLDSWGTEGTIIESLITEDSTSPKSSRSSTSESGVPGVRHFRRKLPVNAHLMHPVSLLNQMHPDAKYISIYSTRAHIFKMKVTIDNQEYVSTGPNKKNARRNCAQMACINLFDIDYSLENSMTKIDS